MRFCRAAALPRDYCGDCIQMRLSYSPFAPFLLYLIEWMDYSCTDTLPSYLGLLDILINKVGCYLFLLIFSSMFNLCIGVLLFPRSHFRNPNEALQNCPGICWWNANNVLKGKESNFTGILWYFLLSVASC